MEESFCLPPRAQALARTYALFFESLSRLARRRHHSPRLTCRPNHGRYITPIGLLFFLFTTVIALSGCGSSYTVTAADIGAFQASTSSLEFGTVVLGQTATSSLNLVNQGSTAIQVSDLKITGNTFAIANPTSLPFTVAANGGTYTVALQFKPNAAGDSAGQLTVSSTSLTSSSLKIKLHGKGSASALISPALNSLSCAQSSFTAAGSDSCTVTLTTPAGNGGLAVNLSSNNAAVSVPGSVTVPAGSSTAGFTATISAITTAQNATLTASAGGTTQTYTIALGTAIPGLTMSTTSLNFGSVALNNSSATQSVTLTSSGTAPLTINSAILSGAGFSVSGMSFPTTLNPGQTATLSVVFDPTEAGTISGNITFTDNASPSTVAISLAGTGMATAEALSGLSCATNSFSGSGSDTCTITLSAPAGSSGLAVSLSSNDSAVAVPASVTIPAGASSVGFSVAVSAVTTTQTAALSGSAGGATVTYSLQLNAATAMLALGSTSVAFGNVTVNSTATQSVSLTSTGTSQLTINAATLTGTGFGISGLVFPLSLNPGQSATLNITFDPTNTGAVTGAITLSTNSSVGGTATIALSGMGASAAYQVNLAWSAPTDLTDPVVGYNVYRSTGTSTSYQLMNLSVDAATDYIDTTVQNGTSYNYYVESVDAQGNQSSPSNTFSVSVP